MGMPAMTNLSMPRCDIEELKGQIEQLKEEKQQLKELLKAANKFLKDYGFSFDGKDCAKAFKVHTEINEVLKCR